MKLTLVFCFLPLLVSAQNLDLGIFGNAGAFGVVLDTFNAPVGPGAEIGVQAAFGGFALHGSVRRGYIGSQQRRNTYNMIQTGLGGTFEAFYFTATLDYTMLTRQQDAKSNGGAFGVGLRFGVDIPISERIGLFGVANLGTNRMHTYMYIAVGGSYHFEWDTTTKSSFYK